ncbi:MAG: putative sensor protein [Frankiales bacterium]|nr:putative sensor protein [Frankiales bacterium]
MRHAEVTLPGQTSSVPTARRFVESLLRAWGRPELTWAAAACVSELAANCALHARTAFTVRVVLADDRRIRVEVSDGSRRLPAPRDYGPQATTGRGLRLLDQLASGWGVDATDDGKSVWVLLETAVGQRPGEQDEAVFDLEALLAGYGEDGDSPAPSASTAPAAPALPVAA